MMTMSTMTTTTVVPVEDIVSSPSLLLVTIFTRQYQMRDDFSSDLFFFRLLLFFNNNAYSSVGGHRKISIFDRRIYILSSGSYFVASIVCEANDKISVHCTHIDENTESPFSFGARRQSNRISCVFSPLSNRSFVNQSVRNDAMETRENVIQCQYVHLLCAQVSNHC